MTNPATSNNYFDFAVQGATTNNSDVEGSVPSLVDQVATFQQFFVPVNSTASVQVPWTPATTLFGQPLRSSPSILKGLTARGF